MNTSRLHSSPLFVKLTVFAMLGYVYIGVVVLLFIAITGGLVFFVLEAPRGAYASFKLGIPIVFALYYIFRALAVRQHPPEQLEIQRHEAGPLFAMLDELKQRMNLRQLDKVFVTGEHNAFVLQQPHFLLFGLTKSYLFIGLPLLNSLNEQQVRALLAHELAHLSLKHGKKEAWIIYMRNAWFQLMKHLQEEDSFSVVLFRKFFNWYVPKLDQMMSELSRQQEFVCDAWAARMTSPSVAANMLCQIEVIDTYFNGDFRLQQLELAKSDERPPQDLLSRFQQNIAHVLTSEQFETMLNERYEYQIEDEQRLYATHPTLKERVEALGVDQSQLEFDYRHSSAWLLGDAELQATRTLNSEWRESVKQYWKLQYDQYHEAVENERQLHALQQKRMLTGDEHWTYLRALDYLYGDEKTEPQYALFVENYPDLRGGLFQYGRILLNRDDEAGIDYMERAIRGERHKYMYPLTMDGLKMLYHFYERRDDQDNMKQIDERFGQHMNRLEVDYKERHEFNANETYLPHQLDEEQLTILLEQLEQIEFVRKAYVARIQTTYSLQPAYILGVVFELPLFSLRNQIPKLVRKLNDELFFPDSLLVTHLHYGHWKFYFIIKNVEGSKIYEVTK